VTIPKLIYFRNVLLRGAPGSTKGSGTLTDKEVVWLAVSL